jgi:hypothetical protein
MHGDRYRAGRGIPLVLGAEPTRANVGRALCCDEPMRWFAMRLRASAVNASVLMVRDDSMEPVIVTQTWYSDPVPLKCTPHGPCTARQWARLLDMPASVAGP